MALSQARHELDATKSMVSSVITENYALVRTAERLIQLYKDGLIPKAY